MFQPYPRLTLRIVNVLMIVAATAPVLADEFASDWHRLHDRIWIGPAIWANPMEDWRIEDGRAVCDSRGGDRNLHILTHQLASDDGEFELRLRCSLLERGAHVGVGFRVGIHDAINDHRGNCFWGRGIDAGIVGDRLVVGGRSDDLPKDVDYENIHLRLRCESREGACVLTLALVGDSEDEEAVAEVSSAPIAPDQLIGNVAVVSNLGLAQGKATGSRWAFHRIHREWRQAGW